MSVTTDPSRRTAVAPDHPHSGPVTLINSFVVQAGREEAFLKLWAGTSSFFRTQPGFISLRLHRAVSPQANFAIVNIAEWASAKHFADAHQTDTFRRLVSQPEWKEFPSSPALYEVIRQFEARERVAASPTQD